MRRPPHRGVPYLYTSLTLLSQSSPPPSSLTPQPAFAASWSRWTCRPMLYCGGRTHTPWEGVSAPRRRIACEHLDGGRYADCVGDLGCAENGGVHVLGGAVAARIGL